MIYVEFKTEEPEGEFHRFLVELFRDEIISIQRDGVYVDAQGFLKLRDDETFRILVDQEIEKIPVGRDPEAV